MKIFSFSTVLSTLLLTTCIGFAQVQAQEDTLVSIMVSELNRSMTELKKAPTPAYYIDYHVNDVSFGNIYASFGSIVNEGEHRNRVLATRVRVGDYAFDNTHNLSDDSDMMGPRRHGYGPVVIPIENNKLAIQFQLWEATESNYEQALEMYKMIRNAPKPAKPNVVKIDDFSKETPSTYYEKPLSPLKSYYNSSEWQARIKKYSALFLKNHDLISGDVQLQVTLERKYFITSEGTQIVQNSAAAYINVSASIRATDGDVIPLHLSYYAPFPKDLPSDEKITTDIAKMMESLQQLNSAPLAEPYSGPAILYASTAGVFFHEIFGHRIEGHRLKNEYDGQTFKAKINELVLAKTLNVYFDPTLSQFKGHLLNGSFQYDDEGVKSRRTSVVENGMLKTFLMSRTPLEGLSTSNGHGRASFGEDPVSRQSNLVVESSKPVPMTELRKMLLKECKKQGKKYGYLFKEVVGGYTVTDRFNPNAFNIFPTLVYRIYTDGRADELVRGVDLIGTPLAMFAEIQAAADDSDVFIGFCGAESGSVPVSAVSPSLFVRRIETQKKPKHHQETTLLARPASDH